MTTPETPDYTPGEWDADITETFFTLLSTDPEMAFLETAVEGMLEANDPPPAPPSPAPAAEPDGGVATLAPEMLAHDIMRLTDVDGDSLTVRYFTPDRNVRGTGAFVYFQPHPTGVIVNTSHLPNLIAWLEEQGRKGRSA